MKKRALSLILAAVMVCALLPTAALADTATPSGQHYADVPTDAWYAEAVNAMTEGGLLTGYTDGLFHPDDPITYAQFSMVLARVMGLETANPVDAPEGTHWAQTAYDGLGYQQPNLDRPDAMLEYVHSNDYYKTGTGLFTYPDGTLFKTVKNPDGTFRDKPSEIAGEFIGGKWIPYSATFSLNDNIFRAEVLETLVKLAAEIPVYRANRHNGRLISDELISPVLSDDIAVIMFEQISPKIWNREDIPDWDPLWSVADGNDPDGVFIRLAYNIGITNGVDANGTCNAYGNVTRAQLCQLLWNMGITTKNSVKQTLHTLRGFECWVLAPDTEKVKDRCTGETKGSDMKYHYGQREHVVAYTNLQFFELFPTYYDAYKHDYICHKNELDEKGVCHCRVCLWHPTVKEEDNQRWENDKRTVDAERQQWLKEFEGTRQWEIATGKA